MDFFDKFKNFISDVNPSNYRLVDNKEYENVWGNYQSILKTFDKNFINNESRPSMPIPYMDTPTGSKIPLWRVAPMRLYEMADYVGDLRVVMESIQRDVFKNGSKVKPKFKYKCDQCLKEFKEKPTKKYTSLDDQIKGIQDKKKPAQQSDSKQFKKGEEPPKEDDEDLECDECGNTKNFTKPKPEGRIVCQTLITKPVNNNRQKLQTVGRQIERDWDIMDQSYTVITQKYVIRILDTPDPKTGAKRQVVRKEDDDYDAATNGDGSEFYEILRVHPAQASLVASNEGRLGINSTTDEPAWICPDYKHRNELQEKPYCSVCGCECFTAYLEANSVPYGVAIANPKKMYYAEHEVIFTAGKYYPDLLYGNSPIFAIWKKVMSLYHQDEYIWKYFDKDRPPKSILGIGSRNFESVSSFFERQKMGARSDPYMPRPILLNTENASQALQFIDLTPNFKELELSELRKELRQLIATMYGVQPIKYGESGSGGGLGNESLQVKLSNDAIKAYQKYFNENFYAPIVEYFGVTDWEIVLVESEEIDNLREAQIKGQKIDNISKIYNMGFDVWSDGNGEFQHSQFPNPERQMMQLSSGPGKAGKVEGNRSSKPKQEMSTNFDGEPLKNRPSDEGGEGSGSPSAGFSFSNKEFDEKFIETAREVLEKGVHNNWTLTNMSKKLAEATGISPDEALNIIKSLILRK